MLNVCGAGTFASAAYVGTFVCAVFQHRRNITLVISFGYPWHEARRATGARTIVHAMGI